MNQNPAVKRGFDSFQGISDYNFEKNCSEFAIKLPIYLRYHLLQGLQAG